MIKAKQIGSTIIDLILAIQPLFAAGIYLTFLVGNPPLWASWCIALLPWVLRFWRNKQSIKFTPFDIPIFVFIVAIIVGYAVSPDKVISWQGLHTFLACILIYYGIVQNYEHKAKYWITLGAIICLIILGLTLYTFFHGANRYYFFNEWIAKLPDIVPQIGAFKPSYNTAGAALGIAIPLLFALALFLRPSVLRRWIIATLLLFSVLLFLNGSGGAWLTAVVGIFVVLAYWKLWTLALTLPVLGVGSWIAVSSMDATSPVAQTWVTTMFPLSSMTARIDLWRDTIGYLNNHILTGPGLGTWYETYLSNGGKYALNTHNTYLQLYYDTGLIGAIAVLGAVAAFIFICWRIFRSISRNNQNGLAIGIISSILAGGINAIYEVNTSATLVKDWTIVTHYLAIPYLWFWAAFLAVVYLNIKLKHNNS